MKTIILLACVAFASAQFNGAIPGFEEATPRWTGPLADHVNGQLVADTPEVARAKAQHALAHSQVEAVLPKLPPEIRYQMTGIVNPIVPQQPHHVHNPQPTFVPTPFQANNNPQPIHTSPQFTQFAEEIPRSPIGEVPDVHAARVAHLAAHQQVRQVLPSLNTAQNDNLFANQPQQQQQQNFFGQPQQDTPEVAAARAAHLRAFQSVGK